MYDIGVDFTPGDSNVNYVSTRGLNACCTSCPTGIRNVWALMKIPPVIYLTSTWVTSRLEVAYANAQTFRIFRERFLLVVTAINNTFTFTHAEVHDSGSCTIWQARISEIRLARRTHKTEMTAAGIMTAP